MGPMEQDKLLASVMRKTISQRHNFDGCYIDVSRDSMCVDGWVNDLTPLEVQALNKIVEETKEKD